MRRVTPEPARLDQHRRGRQRRQEDEQDQLLRRARVERADVGAAAGGTGRDLDPGERRRHSPGASQSLVEARRRRPRRPRTARRGSRRSARRRPRSTAICSSWPEPVGRARYGERHRLAGADPPRRSRRGSPGRPRSRPARPRSVARRRPRTTARRGPRSPPAVRGGPAPSAPDPSETTPSCGVKPEPNAAPSARMIRNGKTNTKNAPVLSRNSRRRLTPAIASAFRRSSRHQPLRPDPRDRPSDQRDPEHARAAEPAISADRAARGQLLEALHQPTLRREEPDRAQEPRLRDREERAAEQAAHHRHDRDVGAGLRGGGRRASRPAPSLRPPPARRPARAGSPRADRPTPRSAARSSRPPAAPC